VADKSLAGVICLRLDATVVPCHSDKEGAEPNFKGFGLHPLGCWCDNTGEPLAAVLRPGSAGSVRHEVAQVEWIHREEAG
jgi:hypothetical protein